MLMKRLNFAQMFVSILLFLFRMDSVKILVFAVSLFLMLDGLRAQGNFVQFPFFLGIFICTVMTPIKLYSRLIEFDDINLFWFYFAMGVHALLPHQYYKRVWEVAIYMTVSWQMSKYENIFNIYAKQLPRQHNNNISSPLFLNIHEGCY